MAVKVLIKRKFKDDNLRAASRFLVNNRIGAMKQPGYISSETLRNIDDPNTVLVISMWEDLKAWEAWETSYTRKANEDEFKGYLIGETEYESYSLGLPME
ncbi:MAG: antibiotic biosynthesis monooxygenase family protein [Desulfobacterales bacterium]